MMKLIKRGNAHAVYLNTETREYELWVVSGDKMIDQDDVFTNKQDALECLEFADQEFAEFFFDTSEDEDEDDWSVSTEDLTEWMAASSGCGYYTFIGQPWRD